MAANAIVLYALIAYHLEESKKRAVNLLMINQNVLDLSSCILLIITFSVRVSNIYLTGARGYFLCTLLTSENATYCTTYASIINRTTTRIEIFLCVYRLEINYTIRPELLCVINESRCDDNHSIINLMSITVERYLKVVHPFWSKRNLKRWMIYAAMVFAWIGGTLTTAPVVFISTIVQDGICLSYFVWRAKQSGCSFTPGP